MAKNAERQRRGEACIRHWKRCAGEAQTTELGEEDAVDLVTDIFHYCRVRGFKISDVVAQAEISQLQEEREESQEIP